VTKPTETRLVWAYEADYRTATIIGAASTSYWFGKYDDSIKKWNAPGLKNKVGKFYTYNSRTPTLVDLKRDFPAFKHVWNPTTAQHAVWLLGKCTTTGDPETFDPYLVATQKNSLTVRWEEDGGSNDMLINAVGCYLVELYGKAAIGSPYLVEGIFAWSDVEDKGDGANAILTTAPTICGGADVSQMYDGNPTVVYDYLGGGSATLTDVIMAEWRIKQNYKTVKDTDELGQAVYLYEFDEVELILTALMESDAKWDDFIDRTPKDYSVKVFKPDGLDYITWIFDNVRILDEVKEAEIYEGLVTSQLVCKAEKATGIFTFDGSEARATHFKTAA